MTVFGKTETRGELNLTAAILLAILAAVLACDLWYTKRQLASHKKQYIWLLSQLDLFIYEYSVPYDELRLSDSCAELLQLPPHVYNFTDVVANTKDKKLKQGLSIVKASMDDPESELNRVNIPLKDGSVGVYTVRRKHFYGEKQDKLSVMGVFIDVTADARQESQLRMRAEIDGLTQVYNSATSRMMITQELDTPKDEGYGAFLMMDVDKFKSVNDNYGHQIGDKALQFLAKTLKSSVRGEDIVGRLGGDEFCVFLRRVSDKKLVEGICQKLNLAMASQLTEQMVGCPVTISIGGAMAHAGDTLDELYKRADESLYIVKERGRNSYWVAE